MTTGSSHDPLPIGKWGIRRLPQSAFPLRSRPVLGVPDSDAKQKLPPGPNGPVGVVWIDLSKEHYGIHGTSAPETIGRAQSHGCVRLTNWDAARLAQMVDTQHQGRCSRPDGRERSRPPADDSRNRDAHFGSWILFGALRHHSRRRGGYDRRNAPEARAAARTCGRSLDERTSSRAGAPGGDFSSRFKG